MVLVSIITPSYNSSDTIVRAIESVREQTYDSVEHIIVDDGSSDDTEEVVNEHRHDQLRFLQFEENRGANAARNEGIRAAEGDLVSFLDADDVLRAKYLERVVDEFSIADSECAGVASSYTWVNTEDETDRTINHTPNSTLGKEQLIHNNPIGSFSATTFRKSVFDEVGYLDEDLKAAQDYDFYLRVVDAGYVIRGLDANLVTKYDRKGNISSNLDRKEQAFNQLINKHGDLLSPKRLATQHNMLGLINAESGNFRAANREFRTAIKYNPFHSLYYYHLCATSLNGRFYNQLISLKRMFNRNIYGKILNIRGRYLN